jgi:hypothetical protein
MTGAQRLKRVFGIESERGGSGLGQQGPATTGVLDRSSWQPRTPARRTTWAVPHGYTLFLEILGDPTHEQLEDMVRWIGCVFDAKGFDLNRLNREFKGSKGRRY